MATLKKLKFVRWLRETARKYLLSAAPEGGTCQEVQRRRLRAIKEDANGGLHHKSSVNTTQGVGLHRKTKMITEAEK